MQASLRACRRDAGQGAGDGASGSRNCRLRCTGPVLARAVAWRNAVSTVDSATRANMAASGGGTSAAQRAHPPKIFTWGVCSQGLHVYLCRASSAGGSDLWRFTPAARVLRADSLPCAAGGGLLGAWAVRICPRSATQSQEVSGADNLYEQEDCPRRQQPHNVFTGTAQPTWSMVWLAPVSRSSPGRSADSTSSGTPLWDASTTAGRRLATAVPEDVMTTAGILCRHEIRVSIPPSLRFGAGAPKRLLETHLPPKGPLCYATHSLHLGLQCYTL